MKEISFEEARTLARQMMDEHGLKHWHLEFMDTERLGGQCCPSKLVYEWFNEEAKQKFLATNPEKAGPICARDKYDQSSLIGRMVYKSHPKLRFSRVWITKYGYDGFVDVVLHEIAHALIYERKIPHKRDHGPEWAKLAFSIGVRDEQHGRRWGLRKMAGIPRPARVRVVKPVQQPEVPSAEKLAQQIKDRQKKLRHAQKQAKATATRIKRSSTALKRWQRRVKLYTTKLSKLDHSSVLIGAAATAGAQ